MTLDSTVAPKVLSQTDERQGIQLAVLEKALTKRIGSTPWQIGIQEF